MFRSSINTLEPFDPEIERSFNRLKRANKEAKANDQETMANQLPPRELQMKDYERPSPNWIGTSVARIPIEPNNFVMDQGLIKLVRESTFAGLLNECPMNHLRNYMRLCSSNKHNGVPEEYYRMSLFFHSLRDDALKWLEAFPANYFVDWNQLSNAFLERFYPQDKTIRLRNELTVFDQKPEETLSEAWERFKEMQRECPHHGIPDFLLMESFYNGLREATRDKIDASSGGYFKYLTLTEGKALLEKMSENRGHPSRGRYQPKKIAAGIHEVDNATHSEARLDQVMNMLSKLSVKVDHMTQSQDQQREPTMESIEQAHYVQNNPYSQTYNPGSRNHPNFSWSNQSGPQGGNQGGNQGWNQGGNYQGNYPPNNQGGNQGYNQRPQAPPSFPPKSSGPSQTSRRDQVGREEFDELKGNMKNIERLLSQLVNDKDQRNQGSLPSQTEVNPREHVNAISTRSGKTLEAPKQPREMKEKVLEKPHLEEIEEEGSTKIKEKAYIPPPPYVPPIPFPNRLIKRDEDKQFDKFKKILKQLHISIPFTDAITQMPKYAKFLKEILSKKRKVDEVETVAITENCSSLITNKMPQKLKDPGSFTLPCSVGTLDFSKALCDLGASISLMPLSVVKRLGLKGIRESKITLQLADRSTKKPVGVLEDVLVKVDKFFIPVDFVILDMPEDLNMPLIFGRPFLATVGANIDVRKGKLTLDICDEKVEYNLFETVKAVEVVETCFNVESVQVEIKESGEGKEATKVEIRNDKPREVQKKPPEEKEGIKVGDIVRVTSRSLNSISGKLSRICLGPFKVVKINKHGKVEVQHEKNGKYSYEKKNVKRCQFVLRKVKNEGSGSSSAPLGKPPE